MGKGDKKSARGKRFSGSYGKTRQKNKKVRHTSKVMQPAAEAKEEKPKKGAAKKTTTAKKATAAKKTTAAKKPAAKKPAAKKTAAKKAE